MSNPIAMISFAFSREYSIASSNVRLSLNKACQKVNTITTLGSQAVASHNQRDDSTFSSSVSITTNGTSNTSCNHFLSRTTLVSTIPLNWQFQNPHQEHYTYVNSYSSQPRSYIQAAIQQHTKGIECPICRLPALGPRPVYKKKSFPCS